MDNKITAVLIAFLVISCTLIVTMILAKEPSPVERERIVLSDDTGIEPIVNVTWVQLKMKMGYRSEYENGTVTRGIHNYNGGAYISYGTAYNITVTVKFHYENAIYRRYTTETYNVTDKMELWGYYLWDITEIDGLYYDAEAHGWQEKTEIVG